MAKNRLKKQSKRQPARLRYKIEKKVRDHNRKQRRDAKKNPKKNKTKIIQIPNGCPFKEDILKEVEVLKKQKEDEKKRLKEAAKLERQNKKENVKGTVQGLEDLVKNAEIRGKVHETLIPDIPTDKVLGSKQEQSLKQYYREFKKVIEAADVILEVVDARDPLGTRCRQVEEAIKETMGNKKLVLVLNKADLVPRNILDQWLKYLKKTVPTIAFKASVQSQNKNLAQRKLNKSDKSLKGAGSVGAELIMSLLGNYCRNKDIKTSITVGIVGLPNVGKSSVINSLKRSRVCNVGASPGITRAMQVVQLDSKIKLLDSPGIVFAAGSDSSAALRNAIKISALQDPFIPANAILQRVSKQQMMEMYRIADYSSHDEFYALKAARHGQYKRGGVVDTVKAARSLLEDWNSGKIQYYTVPPEVENNNQSSYTIVSEVGKEFDLNSFESMETEILNKIEKESEATPKNSFKLDSLGPVDSLEEKMDDDTPNDILSANINVANKMMQKNKNKKPQQEKQDPEMMLEGNQKLNQLKKVHFKKAKKEKKRREKVALQLSEGLESFSLSNTSKLIDTNKEKSKQENYDFDTDFVMK